MTLTTTSNDPPSPPKRLRKSQENPLRCCIW
jgi:hypothetical protein